MPAPTAELQAKYLRLMAKVARFSEARRIAESAFKSLKESEDWDAFCAANGLHTECDFGDLSC